MTSKSSNHLSSILGDVAVIHGMLDAEVSVAPELEARLEEAARLLHAVAEELHEVHRGGPSLAEV